jgi:P-type Cu+ transporter
MSKDKPCCGGGSSNTSSASAKDPVCGMTVEPQKAKAQVEHLGQVYYFCYVGCAEKFKADPEAYLNPERKKQIAQKKAAASGNGYTCPMHPEVVSDKLIDCPLCGMSLEPMMPGDDEAAKAEVAEIKKRLFISAALAIPLFVLSMSHMLGRELLPHTTNNWLQFALATPVVLWAAQPFIHRGWQSVKNTALNMFTLLSLGIVIPYLYSVYSLFAQAPMLYFESAAVITTLAWFGQLLEAKARVQSASAVKQLVSLMPSEATVVLPDGSPLVMPLDQIPIGAEVRIKPGERIPIDGKVLEGESFVDESMLTGEPKPELKSAGTLVSAGTLNSNGSLLVEVQHIGNETLLAQIIALVSEAQRSKLPVQKLVDKVAAVFVPLVLAIAVLTFVAWVSHGTPAVQAMTMAVAVLVIACPCALGLATPMSVIVAAGRATKAGVLFKDAISLEALSHINTLVIDKTGTLTEGKMSLTAIVPTGTVAEDQLLALAAAVEAHSEHPLAHAVVAAHQQRNSTVLPCESFKVFAGEGVSGIVNGQEIKIGSKDFASTDAGDKSESDKTEIFISIDGKHQGQLHFADKLRPDAAQSIKTLQKNGITVVLATGDKEGPAKAIADAVGIKDIRWGLMPADKGNLVKTLQEGGFVVAMAGDGINDAPALAQANIGIAMASGTGVAVSSAGIVILNSDIAGIVRAHKVSKAMLANIGENLFLAFGYNALAIPAAAGLLLPITGIALNPMVAAAAMSLSSVSVIANALRLRGLKL